MIRWRKIAVVSIITILLVPTIALADVVDTSKVPINKSGGKDNFRDSKYREQETQKIKQIADEKNTLIKAESIIPGIIEQREAVIKERLELIRLLMLKDSEMSNNNELANIINGSIRIAWDNFSESVKTGNKDEIKNKFNKFIALNKETNELLKLKLKLNSN